MAQQIDVSIVINGEKVSPFSALSLKQEFNEHHYFELYLNHDVLEAKGTAIIKDSQKYLGESITITFNTIHKSNNNANVFKGIITEIGYANNINSAGDIVLKGYSPTILMEGGETNSSYLDKNLVSIVKDALGTIPSNVLQSNINPAFKSNLTYIVQYNESNFSFIRRLAAENGEWFFYDGSKFNFGKPSQSATVEINFPRDISDFYFKMKMKAHNFKHADYFSKEESLFVSDSKDKDISGAETFGKKAIDVSKKAYATSANNLALVKTKNKGEIDTYLSNIKSSEAGDMVVFVGASDNPFIRLGDTLNVSANNAEGKKAEYGKYVVTSVTHSTDGLGNYMNSFEAVPSGLKIVSNKYYKHNYAEPQMGVVLKDEDPDKQGKVQVQLHWQEGNQTTPFIEVMSPHAGKRGDGKPNRGLFFTPEIGDVVVIGFTNGNPQRPFVMGSIASGKNLNNSKSVSKNTTKAIRTRTGSTIYFEDKNDKENEIRIATNDQNYISILVKSSDGTIEINSTKEIIVKAKDDIKVESEKTVHVKSKDITVEATGDLALKAMKKVTIEGNSGVEIKASGGDVKGEGVNIALKGQAQFTAEGGAKASVKGNAQLELQGGAQAMLKGGIVMIN